MKKRFRPPIFTKFDELPSRPKEYSVRPNMTAVREALTLVGDETMCVLEVDDGPESRH